MDNNGIKYGLLAGLGVIVYTLILYLVDEKVMLDWKFSLLGLIIYIVCMYKAGTDERKEQGGFMTWKEALKPTYLTYVVALSIATIFSIILFTAIDPGLIDIQKELMLEQVESMSSYMSESELEKQIERIEAMEGFDFKNTFIGYGVLLIFGFLIAAVISAVVKIERPAGV